MIIGFLDDDQYWDKIMTESQFEFLFPIFRLIFKNCNNEKYTNIVGQTVSIFCRWLLRTAPGETIEIRNKILRACLTSIQEYCETSKNISHIQLVANVLETVVLTPPCEYEDETWILLMELLPKFIDFDQKSPISLKIWTLSMQIFVTSGLITPRTIEIMKSRPDNLAFQILLGDITLSLIIPQYCHPRYFTQGKWTEETPVTAEFITRISDAILSDNQSPNFRQQIFYGICVSITRARRGIISFEYQIEDILPSFADTIFPLDKINPSYYGIIFDFFASGKLSPTSDWFSVLKTAIRNQISKISPLDVLIMMAGMSNLISHRPELFIDLIPDMIISIKDADLQIPAEYLNIILHICTSLNELGQLQDNNIATSLVNVIRSKKPYESPIYSKIFNAMTIRNFENLQNELSFLENSKTMQWLLYEGFAPHFSQNLVTIQSVETRIAQFSKFKDSDPAIFLLYLIEVLSLSTNLQHNQDLKLKIFSVADRVKNIDSCYFLAGFLQNLVAIPIKYQLSAMDVQKEIEKSSLKVRFNSGIASSSFAPDGTAFLIIRNQFSMSAFRVSPTQPSTVEPVELPVPTNPPKSSGTANFKPFIREDSSRPPDTFSILASLGLFTANNKNRLEIFPDTELNDLQNYEKLIGPKVLNIPVCRLSQKYCNDIFEADKSTSGFNNFLTDLENFRNCKVGKNLSNLPVPSYDTALFRFNFVSTFHYPENQKEVIIEQLLKSKCIVVFSEGGSLTLYNKRFDGFDVVINVAKVSSDLYSMEVLKVPERVNMPFEPGMKRLVVKSNLSHEIALIFYLYVSTDIEKFYVNERLEMSGHGKLFSTNSASSDGLELLNQLFSQMLV
ncbi:hypothetical protein TVAG_245840 [Trichomonas vaginalis G3]|uniref:Uncharacterized protein n=1 Tax=Trichomonas vaginalis (strain ATCC PRA-98 / G3) TaxID=412133 RepID=A2E4P2_TRIV3|nr:hypothetical protein TVAGG3_0862420 [Trichomonas vaginalis G3]EAY12352.1 hypothetical protein TVAG_245840 [Trichomonas vaginalis G3]KAI5500770.1 hypothetical protein TVAGG3_0862420 [Trichomonas vaginalis G3]|eukprot:XP_001324575.1 hypothetical protein [Trichomonas vaginalis G3]